MVGQCITKLALTPGLGLSGWNMGVGVTNCSSRQGRDSMCCCLMQPLGADWM